MMTDPPATGLRIGSLCSGYGGLDMAVQAVFGGVLTWVADPDAGATVTLAHHHPQVPNLGDITTLDWAGVPPVDVLTAGFPCQDISYAGLGAGIEGSRSGVWRNVAGAIRVLRPRLVYLENVAALLVRGFDRVAADLAALGYDTEWTCLRASDIGAPHRRERCFIAAWPADTPRAGLQGQGLPRWAPGSGGTDADPDRVGREWNRAARQSPQRHAAGTGRVAPDTAGFGEREPADPPLTVTAERDARPEPGRRSLRATAHPDRSLLRNQPVSDSGSDGSPVAEHPRLDRQPAADPESHRWDEGRPEPARQQGRPVPALHSGTDWGTYAPAIHRWEHLTGRPAPDPTEPGRNGGPQLSPGSWNG